MSEQQNQEPRGDWSVVVLYENDQARELGVQFCDALVERFWSRYNFDVSWWALDMLREAECGAQASGKAQEADLIVFASEHGHKPADYVRAWVDSWLPSRSGREGALVAISAQDDRADSPIKMYLRRVAHAAGLDFLTGVPQHLRRPIPESLDSFCERAGRKTSVLDEILVRRGRPLAP